ncbi:uncharacterized protein LOC132041988 [Lycium ferocissimum]|uniref:uncharacterized protein LOC132041988 n=1 Tax=Lycium ferocissimum TaxID=112874 RepID=UPI002814D504|nr:uncharacterized protein LOC132041988 [Lycium ferocissimum]
MFLEKEKYPEGVTLNHTKTIRKLANGFFLNKNVLYKRTSDLRLLRCIDPVEATRLIKKHEQLPYALLGYRTTARTSTGATPYLLMYGTEAVIPSEVEIPSLRIIQEAELDDVEWISKRYEQLALIDKKRMIVVCHGQIYQQRIARAFNKHVRTRMFQIGQLVLKQKFPNQEEYKGKFAPNWQGPYMVRKVLSRGAVVLAEMDGQEWPRAIN